MKTKTTNYRGCDIVQTNGVVLIEYGTFFMEASSVKEAKEMIDYGMDACATPQKTEATSNSCWDVWG